MGFAHPSSSGESVDRKLGVGPEAVQAQAPPLGGLRLHSLRGCCVGLVYLLRSPLGLTWLSWRLRRRKTTTVTLFFSLLQVVDEAYTHLINFVYDQHPESRPLDSPLVPPRCAFEELFTIANSQGSSRPKIRGYPFVEEIVSQTQDRSAKLARDSKPLHQVKG